ncbi:hypothetical protein EVJ58_g6062 [Rhodofomes roseus]|uniref:Uncharacterized protein n=1 Tax=Rhodofomes roseus TaxID=34475 RepID=A0A4Y9Y9T7_9APHY|nr:hypothetical protein EVJ58_g6062 [Rhodofomes roseus]
MNTRARSVINTVQQKVDDDAARYRRVRRALVQLSSRLGKSGWEETLKALAEEDVALMTQQAVGNERESEGHRKLSWIWRTTPQVGPEDAQNPELHEALRIEWCKTRARAKRWSEEVELLQEEMRRVQAYHQWKADEWLKKTNPLPMLPADYHEGLSAYAQRQAEVRTSMRLFCQRAWRDVDTYVATANAAPQGSEGAVAPQG